MNIMSLPTFLHNQIDTNQLGVNLGIEASIPDQVYNPLLGIIRRHIQFVSEHAKTTQTPNSDEMDPSAGLDLSERFYILICSTVVTDQNNREDISRKYLVKRISKQK